MAAATVVAVRAVGRAAVSEVVRAAAEKAEVWEVEMAEAETAEELVAERAAAGMAIGWPSALQSARAKRGGRAPAAWLASIETSSNELC